MQDKIDFARALALALSRAGSGATDMPMVGHSLASVPSDIRRATATRFSKISMELVGRRPPMPFAANMQDLPRELSGALLLRSVDKCRARALSACSLCHLTS